MKCIGRRISNTADKSISVLCMEWEHVKLSQDSRSAVFLSGLVTSNRMDRIFRTPFIMIYSILPGHTYYERLALYVKNS